MIVQVLGCSGSIAAGCRTTSFLLDDDVLIDAGTGVGDMPLDALARIEHILISHSHLDHILSIGLLADSVMRERSTARGPIQVHALPETIAALRTHIFNGVIWPDFTRLPSAEQPMLSLVPFAVGEVLELNGKRVEVLDASHTVPGGRLRGRRRHRGLVGLHRRHRAEPGALGAPRADERRPPRHRDRVQRRRAPARPHQPATSARRRSATSCSTSPAASTCTSPTSSRASARR